MNDSDEWSELADELGEGAIRRVLWTAGAAAAVRAFDRQCAIAYAAELLRQRVGTGELRDRLMARYSVSERTAFRYFAEALKSLPQGRDAGSKRRDYQGSNTEGK